MPTRKEVLLQAVASGFTVNEDGSLSPARSITTYQKYPSFNFRCEGVNFHVHVHRLAAYLKFGAVMFEENILIRHEDNNKENSRPDNLLLGTPVHNWQDNSEETKQKCMSNLKHRSKKNATT